ncbi:hypothetical protein MFFC18_24990 [Mariniblastus fucicola]|uniref:Uncharacterized protein n=1 Tax=Mariniblastus fucicola TaxID=980251 RepID=A0A5B9PDG4_9BACT|nr:hypothetical protein MFFC18_24990 [Mariniblastus fucicola]
MAVMLTRSLQSENKVSFVSGDFDSFALCREGRQRTKTGTGPDSYSGPTGPLETRT